jgi:hypothetical protein
LVVVSDLESWHVSVHLESNEHEFVLDVWRDGEVLDQSSDKAEDWVKLSKWISTLILDVEVVGKVVEDAGEENVVLVGVHADVVGDHLGVGNKDLLDIWEDDEVENGHVDVSFEVHLEGDGDLLLGSGVRAEDIDGGQDVVLVSEDDSVLGIDVDGLVGAALHVD